MCIRIDGDAGMPLATEVGAWNRNLNVHSKWQRHKVPWNHYSN